MFILHYLHFNHFREMGLKSYQIRWYNAIGAIMPFKVIQGHQFLYWLKAHMQLFISD